MKSKLPKRCKWGVQYAIRLKRTRRKKKWKGYKGIRSIIMGIRRVALEEK